jgi:hypothetical protein
MKCFYHPEIDAIGFCKSCGRAFCHGCGAEVFGVLYCRGGCEATARAGGGSSNFSRNLKIFRQLLKILCQSLIVGLAVQVIL